MNPLRECVGDRRVVLAHDWLTGMRGGERVLERLCLAFPQAPLVTLLADPGAVSAIVRERSIHPSALQRLPGIERYYRYLLPFFPLAASSLRLPPADLVISTSHCVARAFRAPPGARHVCYCFTPMRYAWMFHDEYLGRRGVKRRLAAPVLAAVRRWDYRTRDRVDHYIAISRHIRQRIQNCYQRDSDVVYPPVDIERCRPGVRPPDADSYDLLVSALVPYKRVDLAVRAYSRTGFPLRVVGAGSSAASLQAMAAANVTFLGWTGDDKLTELYRGCRLLVFPGEEDFGIVPLEAQACGRPVVAFARGGALETVVEGETGIFFGEQTEESLAAAVNRAASFAWRPERIRQHAESFGEQRFDAELAEAIGGFLNQGESSCCEHSIAHP